MHDYNRLQNYKIAKIFVGGGGEDDNGMGGWVGWDGVGGLWSSFEYSKGRERGLQKLNKCEQGGRGDPNIGLCVII